MNPGKMNRISLISTGVMIILVAGMFSLKLFSQYPGYDFTGSGSFYKIYHATGDSVVPQKPNTGDWISLNMKYSYKDSILFDNLKVTGAPIRFQLPESDYPGDIYDVIRKMNAGDSARAFINADSLFTKTFRQPMRPPFIDSAGMILFDITLLTVEVPEQLMKKELEDIEKYVKSKNITVSPEPSGMYYIETVAGTGPKADTGKVVKAHFTVSLLDGKQLFSTTERGEPREFECGMSNDTQGFEEGISKMSKGAKATFIVPSRLAFGEGGRGTLVPPYATIVYEVELVDLMSREEHQKQLNEKRKADSVKMEANKRQEGDKMKKYLAEKKITAKPTESGLVYVEHLKGTGAKALPGKKVSVHYTGTLLDGTKFDSSRDRGEPFEFVLGQGQVIKGWDEGIALMNVGGKATLIIPSKIAYGERDMGQIPPFSTLVFDVELLDVK